MPSRPPSKTGSSPLTRGKPVGRYPRSRASGLIPAHAGKTRGGRADPRDRRAHPRSRGENGHLASGRVAGQGSSPLTRGKHLSSPSLLPPGRLIPAHAGKTSGERPRMGGVSAHPRSRGENGQKVHSGRPAGGSSPLTRGKLVDRFASEAAGGLIPAHAGKTRTSGGGPPDARAHPRSRGENFKARSGAGGKGGSSPLTRGKQESQSPRSGDAGLIPAHAGKTPPDRRGPLASQAHPRSRGENQLLVARALAGAGSSPLTRGKHFLTCAFIAQIDQILESLELCAFSESYSSQDVYATDAPRDRVRSIDLGLRSSRGAS